MSKKAKAVNPICRIQRVFVNIRGNYFGGLYYKKTYNRGTDVFLFTSRIIGIRICIKKRINIK
jgi:hypothetical protein